MEVNTPRSFTPMQHCIIWLLLSFAVAIWANRLFLWCLFPTLFLLTKKIVSSLENRHDVIDSSCIVSIVVIIGKMQRLMTRLEHIFFKTCKIPNEQCHCVISFKNRSLNNSVEKQSQLILRYVVRDFVSSWMRPITDRTSSEERLRLILVTLQNGMYARLRKLDKYGIIQAYVELFQKHLNDFQEAQKVIKIQPSYRYKRDRDKEFKPLKCVTDAMACRNIYHRAVISTENELLYLQKTLHIYFSEIIDSDLLECPPCIELVSSIITSSVLLPFMELLSQPYFLHIAIIKLTSDDEIKALIKRDGNLPELQNKPNSSDRCENINEQQTNSISTSDCAPSSSSNKSTTESVTDRSQTVDRLETVTEEIPVFSIDEDASSIDSKISVESSMGDSNACFGGELEEAEDACISMHSTSELPDKLFQSISITDTVNVKEGGGNGIYTLYTIEFECWKEVDDIWSLQVCVAKRRYREFVTLHERMEDHPLYRKHLKGISGPAKWLRLPFRNTGEATIERRKKELDKYLKNIIQRTELNNSMALREFLAYTGDSSIAFVRKPSDIYLFDQVVVNTMKKVSSMFGKLNASNNKLPIRRPATQSWPIISSTDIWPIDEDALQVVTEFQQDEPDDITHKMINLICELDQQMSGTDNAENDSIDKQFFDALESSFIQRKPGIGRSDLDKQTPLASSLLDLALQTVQNKDCWVKNDSVVLLFKVLLARFLEAFVCQEIDDATTQERCTYYLELFTEQIWPNGILDTTTQVPSEEQKQLIRQQARQCLHDFFPGILPMILGYDVFDHSVDEVMDCLDYPMINKHFAYCLLDVVLEQVIPEITTVIVQQGLINSDDIHIKRMISVESDN